MTLLTQKARTDLAIEHKSLSKPCQSEDYCYTQTTENGVKCEVVTITNAAGEKLLGRPIGEYVTLTFSDDSLPALSEVLAHHVKRMIKDRGARILAVGLGNREITADAIGPRAIEGLIVTGHLENTDGKLFAIAPSVLGKTGIESLALIQSAKEASKATLAIVIDALAAKSTSRLYQTVQIGNTGIVPGSGVGNHRHAICEKTLGIPVIAIGVPTVVSTATLLCDTLENAGLSHLFDTLEDTLNEMEPFFVTPPDADVHTDLLATVIAGAINML